MNNHIISYSLLNNSSNYYFECRKYFDAIRFRHSITALRDCQWCSFGENQNDEGLLLKFTLQETNKEIELHWLEENVQSWLVEYDKTNPNLMTSKWFLKDPTPIAVTTKESLDRNYTEYSLLIGHKGVIPQETDFVMK